MNIQSIPHIPQGDAPLVPVTGSPAACATVAEDQGRIVLACGEVMRPSRRILLGLAGVSILGGLTGASSLSKDPLHDQAVEIVIRSGQPPSVALVQRRLKIDYKRAVRLVEGMKVVT